MSPRKTNLTRRLACEALENRTLLTSAPVLSPLIQMPTDAGASAAALHSEPVGAAAVGTASGVAAVQATQSLAKYAVGTWVNTIGNYFGVVMQVRQVWKANGTYLTQLNYKTDARGIPHQVKWFNGDYGTWKAVTGKVLGGLNGVIYATSNAPRTKGRLDLVYVTAVTQKHAHFGIRPANAGPRVKTEWFDYYRI